MPRQDSTASADGVRQKPRYRSLSCWVRRSCTGAGSCFPWIHRARSASQFLNPPAMKTPAPRATDIAAQRHFALNRRQFLRGLGACVALPVFESALRPMARAASPLAAGGLGVTSTGAPLRMAFVHFPNGAHQDYWWPTGEGANFRLAQTMQPLTPLQKSIQVLGGLDHLNAKAGNDGAGDHARANATFLTGARARKTDSTDIQVGISVDQVVAQR